MPADRSKRARQLILGRYADWVIPFDPKDYEKNPQMIAKLYEEKQFALASSIDFEEQMKNLEAQVHELKLQNQRLELELSEASRKSFLVFGLSLLATIMVGIGVNIATSASYGWTGWVMIVVACFLEGIAFFSRPQKGK